MGVGAYLHLFYTFSLPWVMLIIDDLRMGKDGAMLCNF
jgi:hypothetical protein